VAKQYLKRTFELNPDWRLQALEDEDLKPIWHSLLNQDFGHRRNSSVMVEAIMNFFSPAKGHFAIWYSRILRKPTQSKLMNSIL
jgi:hypothetical protein